RQHPEPDLRRGVWPRLELGLQLLVCGASPAGQAVDRSAAAGSEQRARERLERATFGTRSAVVGAHQEDRGAPGMRADVPGITLQRALEITQGAREVVAILLQQAAHEQHLR